MRQHHWNMFCCVEKRSLFLLTYLCYQLTSISSIEGLWISRKRGDNLNPRDMPSWWLSHTKSRMSNYSRSYHGWAGEQAAQAEDTSTEVLGPAAAVCRRHTALCRSLCLGRAAECKPMGCVELPHAGGRDLTGRAGITVTSETASSVHAAAFENCSVDVNISALHLAFSPETAGTSKHEYVELQIQAIYRANLTCSVDWQSVVGDWSGRKALTVRRCGREDNPVFPIPSPNMRRLYLCGKLNSFVPKLVVIFFFLIHNARKQLQYAVDSHSLWKYCLMSPGKKGFILHLAV